MTQLVDPRYGFCGTGGLDTSARAPLETSLTDPSLYAPGCPVNMYRIWTIVPLTLQTNNIVTSATVNGAATLTAGTGVTSTTITIGGNSVSVLDITGGVFSRGIRVIGSSGVSAVNFTVTGYDEYNQLTTQTFLGPSGAATTYSTKCWRYIKSISSSATTTNAVTIGTWDLFGFPVAVFNWDQNSDFYWNNTNVSSSTGFVPADTTNPQTASTGHNRGAYTIQGDTSNGTKRLTVHIGLTSANANSMNTVYGITPA